MKLFDLTKKDLETLYGAFNEYKSFESIIKLEYEKYLNTDGVQKQKLEKLTKGKKKMAVDDWIVAVTSWGISPDVISQVTGQPAPGNLYYEIAIRQEQVAKVAEAIHYDTAHFPETDCTYYNSHELDFES